MRYDPLPDDELTRWLAEETCSLCAIPSTTGEERAITEYLVARVSLLSPAARIERLGNNLLVSAGHPHGVRVGLFGHTDTVPPSGVAQPPRIDWESRRVYGLGASDMKAGLAVMLRFLAVAPSLPIHLLCVFYDREEGPSAQSGMVSLCEQKKTLLQAQRLAIVLEPTGNRVEAGCSGSLQATVVVGGKRAHSARPWLGENAIYAALPLLQKLAQVQRRAVTVQGLTFYEVISATQCLTDNARNVIPDRLTLNVNYRFAPGKTPSQAEAELRNWIGMQHFLQIVDASVTGAVCIDEPSLSNWIQAESVAVTAKQAWTDVARLTELGIPAVNYGPGDPEQAHQTNEFCPLDGPTRNYTLLSRLVEIIANAGQQP